MRLQGKPGALNDRGTRGRPSYIPGLKAKPSGRPLRDDPLRSCSRTVRYLSRPRSAAPGSALALESHGDGAGRPPDTQDARTLHAPADRAEAGRVADLRCAPGGRNDGTGRPVATRQMVNEGSINDVAAELRALVRVRGRLMVDAARIELATSALRTPPAGATQSTQPPDVSTTPQHDALTAETRVNTQGSADSCTPSGHKNGHTKEPWS